LSLKTLIIDEFNIFLLPIGLIFKFCHGVSNNLHVDITRCYTYWHKPLINYLVDDVIATYEKLARCCSIFYPPNKPRLNPLFPHAKPKWRVTNNVWFMIFVIGHSHTWLIVDKWIVYFFKLRKSKGVVTIIKTKIDVTNAWFFMFLISNIVLMSHNYKKFHDFFNILWKHVE
jgi:hypothetical protein